MSGLIVNRPQAQAAYNASKAAVIHLTRSLAVEWARYNIRVNAIAPGYMENEKVRAYLDNYPGMEQQWKAAIPLQRLGQPEELGPVAVFLASEAATRYLTGATVFVDGGYTAL
jgi:NAD(P)-dependent dehydrogenase (short-subunit alcohol dehydrogenase family)